jgi:class 3 adenylate cyclase
VAEDTRSGAAAPLVSGADIRTFLFADMRGYTAYTQEHGDDAASALAGRFADVVREAVPEFEGELLELRGDEALCVFRSARQALRASVELQRRLRTGTDEEPAFPIGVGMGLDAGEAVPTQGGYRGASLNVAARLCALAKPGEILATEGVAHLAQRVDGIRLAGERSARLKGLARPVRFVEVVSETPLPPLPARPPTARHNTRWPALIAVAVVLAASLVAVVGWAATRDTNAHPPAGVAVRGNSLAEIDVKAGRVVAEVPLGAQPGEVVSGGGFVWVAEERRGAVVRVDPGTRQARLTGVGISPAALAFGAGSLWVYDPLDAKAAQIDPNLDQAATPTLFSLPPCLTKNSTFSSRFGCRWGGIAVSKHSVWIGRASGDVATAGVVWQVDPSAGPAPTITRTLANVPGGRLAYGAGSIWSSSWWSAAETAQINATSAHMDKRWTVSAAFGGSLQNPGLTYAYGHAWVVSPAGDLLKYGSAHAAVGSSGFQNSVRLPPGSYDVAGGDGSLWVTSNAGTLTQINPYTLRVVKIYRLGHPAIGVCYTKNRVWVSVTGP